MGTLLSARFNEGAMREALKNVKHPEGAFEVQAYISAKTYDQMYAVNVIVENRRRKLLGTELTFDEAMALIKIARIPE